MTTKKKPKKILCCARCDKPLKANDFVIVEMRIGDASLILAFDRPCWIRANEHGIAPVDIWGEGGKA